MKLKIKSNRNSFDIKFLNLNWYIASVISKIFIINFAFSAFIIGCFFDDNQYHQLMFFTEQSNFFALVITIFSLVLVIWENEKGAKKVTLFFEQLRFTAAVLVSITCLIFMCILMPIGLIEQDPQAGQFVWDELVLHAIVPPLVVLDVLIFSNNFTIWKKDIFIPVGFMVFYLAFAIFCFYLKLSFNVVYDPPHNYPYFFMNFQSHSGWFGFDFPLKGDITYDKNAIGSFYWVMFLLGLVLGLSFLYRWILNKRTKAHIRVFARR